jgi:hypothetical protein
MDKPLRAWFQIHLSTAIVLMFVAGGLVWANIRQRITEVTFLVSVIDRGWPYVWAKDEDSRDYFDLHAEKFQISLREKGVPERKLENGNFVYTTPEGHELELTTKNNEVFVVRQKVANLRESKYVIANILTALAIVATTAFACEWRIRRREARKP